jgi:tRNA-specific 2-thiouridylase
LYAIEKFLYVVFDNKQSAITSGQFVAWYSGNELIGSGVIS